MHFQRENGYLIASFLDNDEDIELFELIPLLTFLSNVIKYQLNFIYK